MARMGPLAAAEKRKLGQILVDRGWIAPDGLTRALRNQKSVGGRLGTCLLEMAALPEDRLLRALSEQLGLPPASPEDLRRIPDDVIGILPERLARRAKAIPFRVSGGRLDIAMLDPGDLGGQDEIAFASSKRLNIHIACEVRIAEALEQYYGEPCSDRFATLLDRLNRSRYLWSQEEGEPTPPPAPSRDRSGRREPEAFDLPPDLPELPEPGSRAPSSSEEAAPAAETGEATPRPQRARSVQLTPQERRALYADRAGMPPPQKTDAAPEEEEPFATVEARLAEAVERDEVGRLALDFLSTRFDRAALFSVHGGRVEGWLVRAPGVRPEGFRRFTIALDLPSAFLNLRAGSPFHLGPLAPLPAHRELARTLGGELPASCFLLPVHLGGHLAAVLYGDGRREQLTALPIERYETLAERIAAALQRCIVLKKRQQTGTEPS